MASPGSESAAQPSSILRHPSGKSPSIQATADLSIIVDGLVERRDSASSVIKAVSSQPELAVVASATAPSPRPLPRHAHSASSLPAAARPDEISAAPPASRQAPTPRQSAQCTPRRAPGAAGSSGGISLDGAAARVGSKSGGTPSPSKKVLRSPARELGRMHVEQQAAPRFICPISGRVMRDPVILRTGTTCDRAAFEGWLAKGHKACPVTRQRLQKPITMVSNLEMRLDIEAWAAKHAPWMVDKEGNLKSNAPERLESTAYDPQYVIPLKDDEEQTAPGAAGATPGRTGSRSGGARGASQWSYTPDGKLVTKEGGSRRETIDVKATGAGVERDTPWRSSRGVRSAPRDGAPGGAGGGAGRTRAPRRRDWYSTAFLAVVTLAYVALFLASLGVAHWEPAPMSLNPWFGADAGALARVGAAALPLMAGAGRQWWRLVTSPFVPAGLIHLALSAGGLWTYGRYAQLALPLPQVSVAAVYLLPAVLSSLLSANLNTGFLACGATAGPCALLGCVAADQAVHFRKRKLLNLKEWWVTAALLALNAAAYVALSVLPMTDAWLPAFGLVAGFLLAFILVTRKRAARGRRRAGRYLALHAACAVVLVAAAAAGVLGLALHVRAGDKVPGLRGASCVDFGGKWWRCQEFGALPGGCSLAPGAHGAGGATLTCPGTGATFTVAGAGTAQMGNATALAALCGSYCVATAAAPAPAAVGDASAATAAASAAALPPAASAPVPSTAPPVVASPVALPIPPTTTVTVPPVAPAPAQPVLIFMPMQPSIAPSPWLLAGRKLRAGLSSEDVAATQPRRPLQTGRKALGTRRRRR